MSIFEGARNFNVHGGTFQARHEHHHQAPAVNSASSGFERLQQACAFSACHDAAERFPPPKCHPDTRKAVVKTINDWIKHPASVPILWLYGPAGAGKSAIAQTIAEGCIIKGNLASSFFFSRTSQDRNTEKPLVATLAFQLAVFIPILKPFILKAVERDPSILNKSLEVQVAGLLIKPITEAKKAHRWKMWLALRFGLGKQWPRVFIIDGLDECISHQSQCRILRTVADALVSKTLPFYFLIASRPEPDIRDTFQEPRLRGICRRVILDDTWQAGEDIRIYLRSGFSDVQKKHRHIWSETETWPSNEVIDRLVFKSSGQFIYASTVLKFVDDRRHRPIERLEMILGVTSPGIERPFAELDSLYTQILKSVADVTRTMYAIGMLLVLRSSLTVPFVENFLCLNPGELDVLLVDMHSLLYIPDPWDVLSNSQAISFYHASFSDFLLDHSRSQEFFVDIAEMHIAAMRLCLPVVKNLLNNNSKTRDSAVDEYVCTHWYVHLMSCTPQWEAIQLLQLFDFVRWAEHSTKSYSTNLKQIDVLEDVLDWIQSQASNVSDNNVIAINSVLSDALEDIFGMLLQKRLSSLEDDNLDTVISSELLKVKTFQGFIAETSQIAWFFENWDVGQWVENSYSPVMDSYSAVSKRLDALVHIIRWLSQTCHISEKEMIPIRHRFDSALDRLFLSILRKAPSDPTLILGMLMHEYSDDFYIILELFPDLLGPISMTRYLHFIHGHRHMINLLTFREFLANPLHSGKYSTTPQVHAKILQCFIMNLSIPQAKLYKISESRQRALEYAERNCAFHFQNAVLSKEDKIFIREFAHTHPETQISYYMLQQLSEQGSLT